MVSTPAAADITRELTGLVEEATEQLVRALHGAAAEHLPFDRLAEVLQAAFVARNRIDAAVTHTLGALDRATQPDPDRELTGGLHPAVWLSDTLKISSSAAHAQLRLASQLQVGYLSRTAGAFERGDISSPHVSAVARSADMVLRGGGDPFQAEELMLQEARQRTPYELLRWGFGLVHRLAPEELESEEDRQEQRRFLHVRESFAGGCDIEGHLSPLQYATVRTALNGMLGSRREQGDERTAGQRRADAFVEMARRTLDSGELPERAGQRPHISVIATLDTLRRAPGAPAALLDWGFPISARMLREIATDADLIPVLMSQGGDPLHVGRRYRTATRKMRRALAARDLRCVWPGCTADPDWTRGDHVIRWQDGGRTDIESMRSLCDEHHGKVSEGWRLERGEDGKWAATPPPPKGPVWGPAIYQPPPGPGP